MTSSERKHTPFLEQVATHYLNKDIDLSNYCFVFPNRRSGQFFKDYFTRLTSAATTMLPEVETITELVAEITGDTLATPIEAISILYNAYKEIADDNSLQEFDKFIFWGNTILRDFNDVDMYMVDPEQIFRNVKELKEIGTDYLTPELKQAIENIFKVHIDSQDSDTLWKSVEGRYVKLWEQLHSLYVTFNKLLDQEELSYNGRSLKKAVQCVDKATAQELPHDKYIFAGFNVLSKCEQEIFKKLKQKGLAEFCWDYNSRAFRDDKTNQATKFISTYIKDFPNAIDETEINDFPDITVIGIPSNVGQAKYAFQVVDELVESKKIADVNNAIDTAIVLPDESLFIPLLNSVSDKVPNINVTLGYPLRGSSIVSLMRIVAQMHSRARREGGKRDFAFLKEDVKCVLSHPVIKSHYGPEATRLTSEIDNSNAYTITEKQFSGYGFADLFETIHDVKNEEEIESYIERIKHFVEKTCLATGQQCNAADPDPDAEDEPMSLQAAFARQYLDVLNETQDVISHYGIPMCECSIFYLIDRLTSLYTIPFQGEPLAGLQVMGMLETRCLDFKNLIMLSMSERIFPRKYFSSSFIPVNMRRHYKMSTIEHQESMTAYYFYRLISRAENVYLLYDTTTQSLGSGEHSRFIDQLEKIYGVKMHFRQLNMKIKPASSLAISIDKDEATWKAIEAYRQESSGQYLSASSIKELIRCPLKFYFHHIQKLNEDNDDSEFMDASTFGSIVHDTLQQLYYPAELNGTGKHNIVNKGAIEGFIKRRLENCVVSNTNSLYLHKKEAELDDPLTGDALIVKDALIIFVKKVLTHDLDLLKKHETDYFEIYECEQQHELTLKLPGAKQSFNFMYRIDRADKIGGKGPLRIIDYKTGGDETKFSYAADLVDPTKSKLQAIMQLFLYCNAYAQEHPGEKEIQPVIYKLKDMDKSGIFYGTNEIADFKAEYADASPEKEKHNVNAEFVDEIDMVMSNFFDREVKLKQCDATQQAPPCSYCKFVEFCRR